MEYHLLDVGNVIMAYVPVCSLIFDTLRDIQLLYTGAKGGHYTKGDWVQSYVGVPPHTHPPSTKGPTGQSDCGSQESQGRTIIQSGQQVNLQTFFSLFVDKIN